MGRGVRRVVGWTFVVTGAIMLGALACLQAVSMQLAEAADHVKPAPLAVDENDAPAMDDQEPAGRVDWEYWRGVNPDIVAWVVVPGTNIDQPVVRARPADPEYYLTHDVFGNWNYHGCPYLDAECVDGVDSPNVIICGHNLIDGTMFTQLEGYYDVQFAHEHGTVELYTPQGMRVYEVVGTDTVPGWQGVKRAAFSGDSDFEAYVRERLEACRISLGSFEQGDRLITLYTCSYFENPGNERTVVYALQRRLE